jgi:N-acetylmuramoyl-L-alanine amidase
MTQSMTGPIGKSGWKLWITAFAVLFLLGSSSFAASLAVKKQQARSLFESAERMREELNGLPQRERSRREYQRVADAYRRVYYAAPGSSKADSSVVAVAELLAESGRSFNDKQALRAAISQYEFLRREYPGSKYRFDALFTIGQIYKDDLEENDKAREAFQEVIHRYPHLQLAADARDALAGMDQQAHNKQKPSRTPEAKPQEAKPQESKPQETRPQEAKPSELSGDAPRNGLPLVTGIRHWSTPDYTRVAIDLEQEVKYEAGRVPKPDRIFFDLHDTKLASTLVGKTFEVSDGFLRRVRVAQFQKGMVRVVLEVDDVSDYSVFLLPNPYRLIVDIHGRKPNAPQTMVARAQQEGEKRVPSPALPQETLPPETKPESSSTGRRRSQAYAGFARRPERE